VSCSYKRCQHLKHSTGTGSSNAALSQLHPPDPTDDAMAPVHAPRSASYTQHFCGGRAALFIQDPPPDLHVPKFLQLLTTHQLPSSRIISTAPTKRTHITNVHGYSKSRTILKILTNGKRKKEIKRIKWFAEYVFTLQLRVIG